MISHKEKWCVATAMKRHGGSFVQVLGEALFRADGRNTERIKSCFKDYWDKYLEFAVHFGITEEYQE